MAIQIRLADDHDGNTILNFIQGTLHEMESVGGHEVNHDGKLWLGRKVKSINPSIVLHPQERKKEKLQRDTLDGDVANRSYR